MFKLIFILRKKRRQGTIQAHSLLRFPTIFPIDSYNYLLGKTLGKRGSLATINIAIEGSLQ